MRANSFPDFRLIRASYRLGSYIYGFDEKECMRNDVKRDDNGEKKS